MERDISRRNLVPHFTKVHHLFFYFFFLFLFFFVFSYRGLGPLEFYDPDFVFVTTNLGHILLDRTGR